MDIALTVRAIALAITQVNNAKRKCAKTNALVTVTAWQAASVHADVVGMEKIAVLQSARQRISTPIAVGMAPASKMLTQSRKMEPLASRECQNVFALLDTLVLHAI
jgi:hypothetical protein